ncbi:MAG: selenide, water dikinase SelD, partial [Planctomycetales bacterium]
DFFPPLVDDPFTFGQIAAANSLSDIYAMGGRPVTVLNIVGFPDDELGLDVLTEILRGGAEKVIEAGAVVAGGHSVRDTEIKFGLSVTGVVAPDKLRTNQNAQAGDRLVLTKALGTGFVTTAFKAGRCPDQVLETACQSMAKLNAEGSASAAQFGAHAATDITGFGLAGHAAEMAAASGVTVSLLAEHFPLLPGALDLARAGFMTRASQTNRQYADSSLRITGSPDPLQLEFAFDAQTSGGLLISIPDDKADQLVEHIQSSGAAAACIVGDVLPKQDVQLVIQ